MELGKNDFGDLFEHYYRILPDDRLEDKEKARAFEDRYTTDIAFSVLVWSFFGCWDDDWRPSEREQAAFMLALERLNRRLFLIEEDPE